MSVTTPGSWNQLVKRLSAIAEQKCTDKGFAIITIKVVVDATGQPALWSDPEVVMLEPRIGARAFMEKVVSMLGRGSV